MSGDGTRDALLWRHPPRWWRRRPAGRAEQAAASTRNIQPEAAMQTRHVSLRGEFWDRVTITSTTVMRGTAGMKLAPI